MIIKSSVEKEIREKGGDHQISSVENETIWGEEIISSNPISLDEDEIIVGGGGASNPISQR